MRNARMLQLPLELSFGESRPAIPERVLAGPTSPSRRSLPQTEAHPQYARRFAVNIFADRTHQLQLESRLRSILE